MDTTEKRLLELESKVKTLIEMVTNRPELAIDAAKIKDFVDKYSALVSIIKNDTLTTTVEKINKINEVVEDIQKRTEAPLLVAETQSQKILDLYSSDKVELALNVADVKRFKSEIFVALRDFLEYIKELNIEGKMKELEAEIAIAKQLSNDMVVMRDKLKSLNESLNKEMEVLKKIEEVNKAQDEQITYIENLITTLEKEIESYAFFTNEFNKIYLNAKEFMKRFADALTTLENITQRDKALYGLVEKLLNAFVADYSSLEMSINSLSDNLKQFTQEMLTWLNHSLMFVNEVRAYNLSLNAYREEMLNIQAKCDNIDKVIDNIVTSF